MLLKTYSDLISWTPHQIRKEFGGKALGLVEAHRLGIAVPWSWFLRADSQISEGELNQLPEGLYAVRSSAEGEDAQEHSFAGIFESKLNIPKKGLLKAIHEVCESCHSFRAASYEKAHIRMGVILQPMVEAKYAGVCFTKHPFPATVFENQNMVVEFAPTSGEKVVQGEITPFRLNGTVAEIVAVSDALWMEDLLKAGSALRNYHQYEIDMEFVVDHQERFHLVQQRPISKLHPSHTLNLSSYQRKYKRSLLSFDIELLIDGCSQFLAPYLELPYQLERWMVMITSEQQELWVHSLLDDAAVSKIAQKIREDDTYLTRIHNRYEHNFQTILQTDYSIFFTKEKPLVDRFFSWCEFITPFLAHYYVPMWMIDALHLLLKRDMVAIDPKNAEGDLFYMGTTGISSLMDLLHAELHAVKNPKVELKKLAKKYGFLKCHQVYEEGYTAEDLQQMMEELDYSLPPKEYDKLAALQAKYKMNTPLFDAFRLWMKIRNQEMEFVMFALLSSRPLLQEISDHLKISIKEIWNSSKEMIMKALQGHRIQVPHDHLTIYRLSGRTRMTNTLKILKPHATKTGSLRGKTVYGQGKMKGKVHIAFHPDELKKIKGEILVTGMTTPDFIPYLKKNFAALITDEGGILCHAAIVAREIPIPCIVGTGVATELLKNGMEVEIDFDRGEIQ